MITNNENIKVPHLLVALIPLILLLGLIGVMVLLFDGDILGGASQIAILIATFVCCLLGLSLKTGTFHDFEEHFVNQVKNTSIPLLMLLLIGALSGAWMVSGVVPTMIYYGVDLLHPSIFLLATCIICAIVSITTGSSWTTIATIGLALMGIGQVHGFSDGWIAGVITSGAYFGDKISPLSDTTVMSSSVTNTPLFVHIRYMMITTIPTFIIALIVFGIVGVVDTHHGVLELQHFKEELASRFNITPWLFVVPLITAILIAKRLPSLVILSVSAISASVFALIFQPGLLQEIGNSDTITGVSATLKGMFTMLFGQTSLAMPTEQLSTLVATRGMAGMLNTIWLIICALSFGASMTAFRMLDSITNGLMRLVKGRTSLVATTTAGGVVMNITTADQYVSILLTGNMFKELYKREGYETRLLSRTIEDSVTVTSVLIPWNSCSMTQSAVLNVPTLVFLPYCVFNYLSPITTILVARLGYKIWRIPPDLEPDAIDD